MDIKTTKVIDRDILESITSELIIERILFLWELRDNNIEVYQKNGLASEKEYLYRTFPVEVGIAGGRW